MFYHVIVKPKSDKYYGEYKVDITKEHLMSRFVLPYEQGNPIVINGKTVHPDDVERIRISESDRAIESFISKINEEDRRSPIAVIGGPSSTYRAICKAKDVTDDFIEGPAGYRKIIHSQTKNSSPATKNKVFIVHGHNVSAKSEVARFIEKMGLKPIILHEQASSGKTIIEKIEHYSDVDYAVVLYTPDDVGNEKSKSDTLNGRARQNVIFEHGYLIGKLGREHVAAIVDGDIELPNDISGVVYIRLDSASAWKINLVKEMKQSGYEIDMNDIF